jgi:alpha-N-arabinofuranosidase
LLVAGLLGGCTVEVTRDTPPAAFSNPIIPGFAPDPSIVRVGEDFYLVNSTFEYFPGIPVYHSRDLVDWQLIGHAIHRPEQADLARIKSSDGIHASTIRYHDGLFYVITTNNVDGNMVNFIVTAKDPAGPWSKPHVLEGAPGIDPSLFFDDDGRAWYTGNHIPPDPEFPGQAEIWLQELDLEAMQLKGERHYLWRGCCQGVWAEGPHIYKRGGYYYLMISEGGTSFEHAMSIAISKDITGPYENNPRNPVLTHRHLSYDYPISGVGHADLVELEDGRWYAVALGWRLVDGRHGILGRETFLVPVTWETEPHAWKEEKLTFPVFSPATGKIELQYPTPFGNVARQQDYAFRDDFDGTKLVADWIHRRSPEAPFITLDQGRLALTLQPGSIRERAQYSFVGIRQRHFEFSTETCLRLNADGPDGEAGIALIQNDRSALLLTLNAAGVLRLAHHRDGQVDELGAADWDSPGACLKVVGNYLDLDFHYSADGTAWQSLAEGVDGSVLSPAKIGGYNYTGVTIGPYGSTNGAAARGRAFFDYFDYRPTGRDRDEWFMQQPLQR